MTISQLDELARAEAIAQRDALHALTCGDGSYAVLSRTETRRTGIPTYHRLTVDGAHITCNCKAGRLGRICAHRAAVRMAIVEARYAAALHHDAGWVPAMAPGLDRDSVEYDDDPSATASAWC